MATNNCVWAVLVGFIFWLVFLYVWWDSRTAYQASSAFDVAAERQAWQQEIDTARGTQKLGPVVFAVVARPFLWAVQLFNRWLGRAIDVGILASGPTGLATIAGSCGLLDNLPGILEQVRLLLREVGHWFHRGPPVPGVCE